MDCLLDIFDVSENIKLGVKRMISKLLLSIFECWFVLFTIANIFDGLLAFTNHDKGVNVLFNQMFEVIKIMLVDNILNSMNNAVISCMIIWLLSILSRCVWNKIKYCW